MFILEQFQQDVGLTSDAYLEEATVRRLFICAKRAMFLRESYAHSSAG